jgi:hypothetical protein
VAGLKLIAFGIRRWFGTILVRNFGGSAIEVRGMSIRRNPDLGRQAVLWLATAFVILRGAAACGFIVLAAVEQPSGPLLLVGAIFGGIVTLCLAVAFQRDTQGSGRWMLSWLTRHRTNPRHVLRIGRKSLDVRTDYGTNSPPTLDSVRKAAEQNVTWVAHGTPQDRPRPR